MGRTHTYNAEICWTGNKGTGTSGYREYERCHRIMIDGKTDIEASSDPAFVGDKTKHNPEDLFVVSFSECHMLWYLHLCSDNNVIVVDYIDKVTGILDEGAGNGRFTSIVLNPIVTVADASMIDKAMKLHDEAHKKCFMTNSVNFPVECRPRIEVR